tara:strand:- start:1159 stop:2727 length:1569 start_codon:yes stop_codon:yes gene_type:complete
MSEQRQFTKPSEVRLVAVNERLGDANQQGTFGTNPGVFLNKIDIATIITKTNTVNGDGTPVYTKQVVRYEGKSSIPQDGNATYVDANSGTTKNRYRSGDAGAGQDALFIYDYGDGTGEPVKIGEVIANGSTADGALQLDPTSKATDVEKANLNGQIRKNQNAQINSVMDQFPTDDLNQDALNDLGGTLRNDNSPVTAAAPVVGPTPVAPAATPVPRNQKKNLQALRYPVDIAQGDQDVLKFTVLERATREITGGTQGKRNSQSSGQDIFLPIPGGLSDSISVSYKESTLNALQLAGAEAITKFIEGKGAGGAVKAALDNIQADKNSENIKSLIGSATAASALGLPGGVNALLARQQGIILNPNMELLFDSPQLRTFGFTFKFSPREPSESKTVLQIIRTFKQAMVPKKDDKSFFLGSPNSFKVEYIHRGSPNHPGLNKYKECALTQCQVNYTPEGTYNTYRDGIMHSYQMTLQFRELDPIFDKDYDELDQNAIGGGLATFREDAEENRALQGRLFGASGIGY